MVHKTQPSNPSLQKNVWVLEHAKLISRCGIFLAKTFGFSSSRFKNLNYDR